MKKHPLLLIIIGALFFLFTNSVYAQTNIAQIENTNQQADSTSQYLQMANTTSDVPQDFNSYTQIVFLEILSTISCQISGMNPINIDRGCLGPVGDGKIGFTEGGGAIGFFNRSIASTYQIPVSTGQYIAHVSSNFGVTKSANAQVALGTGMGFESLLPFLPIWEAFRNIAYLFFVIFFLIVGLGIMFQLKIDPRGAMAIQNQIPKIIIALLFITFSYAIAGLLVDLMYVSIYLIYGVIAGIPSVDVSGLTPDKIQGNNPFTVANDLANSKFGVAEIASNATGAIVSVVKDVIGLGPQGAPNLADSPPLNSIGGFFGEFVDKIPGFSTLMGFLSKFPVIGGLFDTFRNITGAVLVGPGSVSLINYLITAISLAAGTQTAIQVAQWQTTGGGGGASALGFGGNVTIIPGFLVTTPLGIIVGGAVTGITDQILRHLIPNLIGFLIVIIALLTAMLRLWFMLIKAYLFLFMNIVFAPLWIALSFVPGSSLGIGSWLRSIIANLAVFPAAYAMFLLGKALLDSVNSSPDDVFVPPLIGEIPSAGNEFVALLGLGILLLTPEVVNIVRTALKAPKFDGGGAFKALGGGAGLAGAGVGRVKNALWYTNPKTGEAGRLKALAGRKASEKLEGAPVIGKPYNKIKRAFRSTREIEAEKKMQENILSESTEQLAKNLVTPPPAGTPTPGAAALTRDVIEFRARTIATQAHAADPGRFTNGNYDTLSEPEQEALKKVATEYLRRERGDTTT